MVSVDMKGLLQRLNPYCTNALQAAAGLCVSRTHYEITVEHFMVKMLEDNRSDCPLIFQQFDLDVGRVQKSLEGVLEDFKTGNAAKPVFSPLLLDWIQEAWLIASIDFDDTKIRSGALLTAFLNKPTLFASGRYVDLLKTISREKLAKEFWTFTKQSIEKKTAEKKAAGEPGVERGDGGFLSRFCNDFTQNAQDGKIDPVFGRDKEIRQIIDILARRRKNNPICVGEPGVGKTAVIEGLALRIIEGDVPDILQNVSLLELDMGLLEAGAGMKGEFENRLKGVISEIKASEKPIIMFIDEAHTLIGAGGTAGGGDAANLLKPALARGELRTVAATTWNEYKKYFEKDPALARRFQPVKLDEPSVENTTLILRGIKPSYEASHKVIVRDDAVVAASELADRYITGRFLPDKAIDLLDTSCARIKINLIAKPPVLEDKERLAQASEREKKGMERDKVNGLAIDEERYEEIVKTIETAMAEADKIREQWQKEKEAAEKVVELRNQYQEIEDDEKKRKEIKKQLNEADKALAKLQGDEPLIQIEVNPDVVSQVVADWTGIPLGKVLKDEAKTIINLGEQLKVRVKGQDLGLDAMAEVVKAAKAGIKNPDQPIGVFLLVGPSGVGKTEVSLTLADLLFGSEKNAITINMSEFQESHSVSRLVGSPPGYVGYGEGGMLTEAVRQKPYSVVILDEAEKAHLDVMNLFYQVFDKGMLTDSEGKDINFKNTILILTSNLASDIIQEMTTGDEQPPVDAIASAIRPVLSSHFKPALLARMTVIPFVSLDRDAMKIIVELKLNKIKKTLMENNKMAMSFTKDVVEQIAARCTEVETGARNIEYILNGNILPRMAQEILTHMTEEEMPSKVNLGVDKKGEFTIKFQK